MRRPIVQLSFLVAVAVAAICVLTVAGSATAASSSPHILCPQQTGAQVPPSCCPLPPQPASRPFVQPICCQGTACCGGTTPCCATCCPPTATPTPCCASTSCCAPTACCAPTPCTPGSPTISSTPNPSTAGQQVMISGTATAGAQVVLWRELAHQSSFQQAAQTTADSAGHYTFTLARGTVMADQQWYVASGGARSATVAQHVAALIALASSARSTVVGRTVVLRGHVTPSHSGEVVSVEMSRGGAWHVIARPRLGRGSTYKVSHRFAQSGAVQFRLVLGSDARNERSTSHAIRVMVKP